MYSCDVTAWQQNGYIERQMKQTRHKYRVIVAG